jgi:hypothetical protein
MIAPPKLNTEERFEYDILDLELLGHVAIDLNVHCHPVIKRLFTVLFQRAGNRGFPENYTILYKLLFSIKNQIYPTRDPVSDELWFESIIDKNGYEIDDSFLRNT